MRNISRDQIMFSVSTATMFNASFYVIFEISQFDIFPVLYNKMMLMKILEKEVIFYNILYINIYNDLKIFKSYTCMK